MDPRLPLKFPLEIELRGFSDERLKSVGVLVKKADGSQQLLPMYVYVCIHMFMLYTYAYVYIYILHIICKYIYYARARARAHTHTYKLASAIDSSPRIHSEKSVF